MKIGFTGTRKELTAAQELELLCKVVQLEPFEVHHGDCIGADTRFHRICELLGIRIIIHPPESNTYRAFCIGNEVRKMYGYIARNWNIVDETDVLIACPDGPQEYLRSGTWATIRYARTQRKMIYIIYPNGQTQIEYG
ncbi:hypothetical protein LCGC14_1104290 [marine sediment metagenome]|uniref:DUF2493 domain-containing protein n=1 Tax=marine sediment metagenome TaxID=412755 RepID=A0A0F9MWK7_9ZZZZ